MFYLLGREILLKSQDSPWTKKVERLLLVKAFLRVRQTSTYDVLLREWDLGFEEVDSSYNAFLLISKLF